MADVAPFVGVSGEICMAVQVDWEAAKTTDLEVPVIVAYSAKGNLMAIDGYHRIARAVLEGRETLPCVVLNKTESRQVWM